MLNTYLGQKGYTILKSELSVQQQYLVRDELTIKPYVPGSPVNNAAPTFPAYRESTLKYYVPRYFGEKMFGPAKEYKLSQGHDINVTFTGELRDIQKDVVKSYLNHLEKQNNYGGGLLELGCGQGKTVMGINIISKLQKKTLVIVHKEFLMNQWIERIAQFLPGARIGKIQGQVIDIEDKDIVLGMLQSLSMKDYPSSIFESFGLTIIDEVHHISSEVFSCALFKIVTKYMLGLSATMNRKDGTSKVVLGVFGGVVYKGKSDSDHDVVVRAIDYSVNDDDFNEIKYDYRGNPQFSTMISKLCNYNHRSEFILRIVKDMFDENPLQQIMILAHNKCLLKYLFDAVSHRMLAEGSVGYYIGGMKEAALKDSETKKIVIATYSMAAEALDIKTLTTLIMATPKTDIEQSVGRILREKHSQPIVVDIIDGHDLFQKQWLKRKAFYKKQNYKIVHTTNTKYLASASDWDTIYDPSVKKSKTSEEPSKCLIKLKK